MMTLAMNSLVRRHMKHADAFIWRREEHPAPLTLNVGAESIVGWYENPKPWEHTRIVFTDGAIYVCEGATQGRIGFDEIVGYDLPESKTDSTGVCVRTKDGSRFVRITGRSGPDGKFSDAFALVGLLHAFLGSIRNKVE
jgi:hypothetical protein